mgnify:CR=1 FL=1
MKRRKTRTKFEQLRSTLASNIEKRRILELLGAGNHPARIAQILGAKHRSNIHYWVKKFEKNGLIELAKKDVINIYRLTLLGKKILMRSDGGRGRVVALEDYPVKYEILEGEKVGVDWEKLGRPRNWVKLGFKIGGVRVVKTSRSIIIHPGRVEGFDPYELLYLSGRICDRVAGWLEDHLGMKLGRGEPIRRPGFQVKDAFGKFIADYMTVKNDVGSIDASPPSREGHLDIWSPEYAKEYLLLPARLRSIERIVSEYGEHLRTHTRVMKKLDKILSKLEKILVPSEMKPVEEKRRVPWEI